MAELRLAREEAKRLQREVVERQKRSKLLAAKHATLCLKHAAEGRVGTDSQVRAAVLSLNQ